MSSMTGALVLAATTCDSAPRLLIGFLLALPVFGCLVLSSLSEDVLEAVEQFGVLIIEATSIRKVTPLHALA